MAEQKIEETKPAVPRRVARPFIGPAGAGSSARPPLRPSAPSERPRPAAFAPPLPQQRPSLGPTPEPAALPAGPSPAISPPAAPVPMAAASPLQTPVFELPVVETLPELPAVSFAAIPEEIVASAPTPAAITPVRPVTSEMVAIDAIDAFESVWSSPEITGVAATAEPASAPIDDLSLGGGLDGPHLWTEEITAAPEQAIEEAAAPASEVAVSFDAAWSDSASSDIGMPAWLADDADPAADAVAPTEASLSWPEAYATPPEAPVNEVAAENSDADDSLWPDPLLAEYAPYIPTPSSVGAIPTPSSLRAIHAVAHETSEVPVIEPAAEASELTLGNASGSEVVEEQAVEPLFAEASSSAPAPVTSDAASVPIERPFHENVVHELVPRENVSHEVRVSAVLDRLAERVRSGEIDVSSVAAEAPDAALLASVLAALLGGSSSR